MCDIVCSGISSADIDKSPSSKFKQIEASLKNSVTFTVPLAELVRPRTMEEFVGQENIVGESSFLYSALQSGDVPSLIFWGPPGCGKVRLLYQLQCLDSVRWTIMDLPRS